MQAMARGFEASGPVKSVAVIGAGISGLAAALVLKKYGYKVTLYESEETCGGHALTDTSAGVPVDLGFQVFNLTTYPQLVGMLDYLGVDSEPSDMSFALSSGSGLEWGSRGLGALLAQPRNLLSLSFWRMLIDVVRWGWGAPEVLRPPRPRCADAFATMTLAEYVALRRYSAPFVRDYLLPMCAAIWSAPNADVLAYPVRTMVRFWANHHLLSVFAPRPVWRVLPSRSSTYVAAIAAILGPGAVRTSCHVTAVRRLGPGATSVDPARWGGVDIETSHRGSRSVTRHDAAVLATHADVSLRLLGESATPAESSLLSTFRYQDNDVVLHGDEALMPRARSCWAAWNCLTPGGGGSGTASGTQSLTQPLTGSVSSRKSVTVSYWLNLLQNLPPAIPPLFVTLNPPVGTPRPESIHRRLTMSHPVLSLAAVESQAALHTIQGCGGLLYAGAWAGSGFHEDGLASGLAAAALLGAAPPWVPRATAPRVPLLQRLALRIISRFGRAAFTSGSLRLILPTGEEVLFGTKKPPPGSGQPPELVPHGVMAVRDCRVLSRVVSSHDIGLGEGYMAGEFESPDLVALMTSLAANARGLQVAGSRRNIAEHYDAGNAFYRLFLDPSLTYSSGLHYGPVVEPSAKLESDGLELEKPRRPVGAPGPLPPVSQLGPPRGLQDAQVAKMDAIIARAGLKPGEKVLEVGSGWGAFAIRAASTAGVTVVGVTVSREQLTESRSRVKAAGLDDRVTLLFCDYRAIPGAGTFDAVVSIEMLEAVGHANLPGYFQALDKMLKPGGRAVVQVITMPDERYEEYCASSDFIRAHIFPGGHLPSLGAMVNACVGTRLSLAAARDIGPDYAVTLRHWRTALSSQRDAVLALGYSDTFFRKYVFYFAYCEAAFATRYIHDYILLFTASPAGGAATGEAGIVAAESAAVAGDVIHVGNSHHVGNGVGNGDGHGALNGGAANGNGRAVKAAAGAGGEGNGEKPAGGRKKPKRR